MIDGGGYSHQGKSRIRQQLQEGRGALCLLPPSPPLAAPPPACTASHGSFRPQLPLLPSLGSQGLSRGRRPLPPKWTELGSGALRTLGKPSHPRPAEQGCPTGEPPNPAAPMGPPVQGEAARGATPWGREGVGAGVSSGLGKAAGPLGLPERWVIKGADGELEFDPEKQGLVGTCSRGGGGGGGGGTGLSLDPWLHVCSANFADETLCAEAKITPGSSTPGAPPPASALCPQPPAPSPAPPTGLPTLSRNLPQPLLEAPPLRRGRRWGRRHWGSLRPSPLPVSHPVGLSRGREPRGTEAPGSCRSVCLPEFHMPQA